MRFILKLCCVCPLLWAHAFAINSFQSLSVQDLIDSGEIKSCLLSDGTLQLAHKALHSLHGLENITSANTIKVIDLSHNLLEDLSVLSICPGLEDLRELHVIYNKLQTCDLSQFSKFSMLYVLNLGFNEITEIKPGKIGTLKKLEVLFLNNNLIRILPTDAFVVCLSLQALYLHNNSINDLGRDCLSRLYNLRLLYLYDNLLKKIPAHIFTDLQNLHVLYLRNNNLRELEPGWVVGLDNLEILDLANNNLSGINTKDIGVCFLNNVKCCYL